MISFACISPHPPIILPEVGSEKDRGQVAATIKGLELLSKKMALVSPDTIVISSPHEDWGFNVPLRFLAKGLNAKVETFLAREDSPEDHFSAGKDFYFAELKGKNEKIALVASGDLSHRLKIDGPYGLHSDGTKFDEALINALIKKDIAAIFSLDDQYPEAGECGLRSFCFALGILQAARVKWQPKIISYEAPFGVGYLVADLIGK
jgi:aromatic ring-opening dioxygenase LigB subunit